MPSKSAKQAKLMRAVAHGWKPDRIKGPTQSVAKEFVEADKRRGKVAGYQYGGTAGRMGAARGMMPYRGVPRQRPGGRGGLTPGGPGYDPGGPGTWAGRGGIPGGGMPGGAQGMAAPWQGPGPSPMSPMGQRTGALRQMFQARQGQPGGGGLLERMMQARQQQVGGGPIDTGGVAPPPGRMGTLGGPGYGPDPLGSAGPGGSLRGGGGLSPYEQMENRMRGPQSGGGYGRPGGVPGTIGGFGGYQGRGGMYGRGPLSMPGGRTLPGGKQLPGRRIAPPPGKYPGGGNPMLGGRNPMMRGANRFSGRGRARGMQR